jgi:hypothetical protein
MDGPDIVSKVKQLNLTDGEYIIFGSCPLALAGIRNSKDIDLLVSESLLKSLALNGWKQIHKGPKDDPFIFGIFEAHSNWDFSPYSPTLSQLLSSATYFNSVPFASLLEVRKWKAASSGAKHMSDVAKIDAYLKQRNGL